MAEHPEPDVSRELHEEAEEVRRDRDEVEFAAAERLTFFSDAVVAIAITLLALELPVPHGDTTSEVLHELADGRWDYLAFVISFAVIGAHWQAHHRMFRWLRRLGGRVLRLNMLWLMVMVLTPFVTRLLTEANGAFFVRFGLYALAQTVASVTFVLMIRDMRRYDLFRPGIPAGRAAEAMRGSATMAAVFALSIPVALTGQWAFLVWIAMPLLGRLSRPLSRRWTSGRS